MVHRIERLKFRFKISTAGRFYQAFYKLGKDSEIRESYIETFLFTFRNLCPNSGSVVFKETYSDNNFLEAYFKDFFSDKMTFELEAT